jgi:hypothetical protein
VSLHADFDRKLPWALGAPESFFSVNSQCVSIETLNLGELFPAHAAHRRTGVKLCVNAKHIPAKVLLGTVSTLEISLPALMNPHMAQQPVQAGKLFATPVAQLDGLVPVTGYQMADQPRASQHDLVAVSTPVLLQRSRFRRNIRCRYNSGSEWMLVAMDGLAVSKEVGAVTESFATQLTGMLSRSHGTGCRMIVFLVQLHRESAEAARCCCRVGSASIVVGTPLMVGKGGAGAVGLLTGIAPVGQAFLIVKLQVVPQRCFQHFFATNGAGEDRYSFLVHITAS